MEDLNLAEFDLNEESLEDEETIVVEEKDLEDDEVENSTESDNTSEISLEREDFNKLINCIGLIVESDCTDCDIVNGLIRQRTNNQRSALKVNLSSVLGDIDISLSNAIQKVALLKTFELDDTMEDEGGVDISVQEKRIKFKDKYGHVTFNKPLKKMLNNVYLEDDVFDKKFKANEEKKILECTIPSYIAKRRIKSICEAIKTDVIVVKIKKNKASIDIKTNDIKSTAIKDLELVEGIEDKNFTFEILSLPFAMDVSSDIIFKVYEISSKRILCTFDLNYFKIPISIYTMSMKD